MIQVGKYNTLKVLRQVAFGVFLDDGAKGILLPKRFVPRNCSVGSMVNVFIYHDGEDRLVATTQKPFACVDEIANLEAVNITHDGAFLEWGLMKDLFIPKSQQVSNMRKGGYYLVKLYIDAQTGRIAATEKFSHTITNENLTVAQGDEVNAVVSRRTDIGYVVIVNNVHEAVLHHNEIYRPIAVGDNIQGFIKNVYEDGKMDFVIGKKGYQRVENELDKILAMLQENNGYLPFHDRSDAEEIYLTFGMSKRTFKMAVGNLYKQQKITLEKTGIKLA
jgi:uncharacterized protein